MEVVAKFDKCPDCKASAWLMGTIAEKEKEKGNMDPSVVGCTDINVFCNMDVRRPRIAGGRVPAARVYRDICTMCGGVHTVRIEVGHIVIPHRPDIPAEFL